MTNQEKKVWLNRYREAEAEAVRLEQEIERLYSKAAKVTTTIKMVPGGGDGERSLEAAVEAMDEIARQCGANRLKAMQARREIEDAIAEVPEGQMRMLLRYRYITGMKWDRIAENMNYDVDGKKIYKLHGRALSALKVDTERHHENLIRLN